MYHGAVIVVSTRCALHKYISKSWLTCSDPMYTGDVLSSNDNLPKTKPLVQHSPMEEEAKLLLEEVHSHCNVFVAIICA